MLKYSADSKEFTVRAFFLAIVITVVLAIANAFLALKLGMLTSASIPAAILSMGILKFFKNPSILENNIVQTAASAGEAIAGGIVYTIPALIIIGYWHKFDYFTNFCISLIGGGLGVIFSIPLRRFLVHDDTLNFPEGRAVAKILQSAYKADSIKYIVYGAIIAAIFEFCQAGLHVFAISVPVLTSVKQVLFGIVVGFSLTMLGAGYLMGTEMTCSIGLGILITYGILLPIMTYLFPLNNIFNSHTTLQLYNLYWGNYIKYIGIGALLTSGIIVIIRLYKPLRKQLQHGFSNISRKSRERTDLDIGKFWLIIWALLLIGLLCTVFHEEFSALIITPYFIKIMLFWVLYVIIIGIIFAIITAYFSGMVGVSASPGSAIVMAGLLMTAWLVLHFLPKIFSMPFTTQEINLAEALTIMTTSVLTGIAAIANDNSQDLKIGYFIGATPWKQELALLLGVLVSALIMPWVMQLLFNVYGIAGVHPNNHIEIVNSVTLPAPVAAMIAGMTKAIFEHSINTNYILIGMMIILALWFLIKIFKINMKLSLLGIAMGIYLPTTTSIALLIGGILAIKQDHKKSNINNGILISCGVVTGSALMQVLLTIPFSLFGSTEILAIVGNKFQVFSVALSVIFFLSYTVWFIKKN